MKRVAFLVVGMLLILFFGSCGQKSTGPVKGPVEFWSTVSETNALYHMERYIADVYPTLYPGRSINRQFIAGSVEVRARWRMAVAAGEIPDITGYGPGTATLGQLVRDKTVVPMDDIYAQTDWATVLPPSILWLWTYSDDAGVMGIKGHIYGFGPDADYSALYINEDLFQKYGVTYVPEANLQQFEAMCDAFVAKGVAPLVTGTADKWPSAAVFWEILGFFATPADARKYFTFEGTDSFFPRDAVIKACEKTQEWVKKGYFYSDFAGATMPDILTVWKTGNYPLMFAPSYYAGDTYRDVQDKFNWDMGALLGSNWIVGATANIYALPAGSKRPEDAVNIFKLMTDEKSINTLIENGGVSLFVKNFEDIPIKQFRTSNRTFRRVLDKDMLIPYLDWSNPTAFDVIGSLTSDLFALRITPEEYYDQWKADYDAFKRGQNL
jgi:raffinose/stachyose/melibiose transport system substrate-binding protein